MFLSSHKAGQPGSVGGVETVLRGGEGNAMPKIVQRGGKGMGEGMVGHVGEQPHAGWTPTECG